MIQLRVPCSLSYRNIVLGVVAEACGVIQPDEAATARVGDVEDTFRQETVTAVGEAFNNIAIHGYAGRPADLIELQIEPLERQMVVRLLDNGKSFDPSLVPEPELDALPEHGMGLFIIRSFMDDVAYSPGRPNVLSMTKSRAPAGAARTGGGAPPDARGGLGTQAEGGRPERKEHRQLRRGGTPAPPLARPMTRPRRGPQDG